MHFHNNVWCDLFSRFISLYSYLLFFFDYKFLNLNCIFQTKHFSAFLYARKRIKFTIHILFTLFLSRFIFCELLSVISQVTVHFFPFRNIRCDILVCSFIFFIWKRRIINDHILLVIPSDCILYAPLTMNLPF